MAVTDSFEDLFDEIKKARDASPKKIFLVLIGGCSRSGKTTLSQNISDRCRQNGIESAIVRLDSWLIGVDERKPESTVSERYEMDACNKAIENLLEGEIIIPPYYDPVSRKRIVQMNSTPIKIDSGILIVEGVLALSDSGLRRKKGYSVFVAVSHLTRIKRLLDFYGRVKQMPLFEYKQIIREREKEEISFINQSAHFADRVYKHTTI